MATKVKPGYMLVPCTGEAHSNPHIDNCMVCAPRWGQMEVRNPRYRTRHDFVAEILAICNRIARAVGHSSDYARYLDQITAEEKQHRKGAPVDDKPAILVGTAALLFCARNILRNRCAGGQYQPHVRDIFHVKLSIYMGAALYINHKAALDAEFSEDECRAICAEDYAQIVQGNFDRPAEAVTPDADA